MLKVAILGTSNSVMRNGYVHYLKLYDDIEVISFGVGDTSSIYGVYKILTTDILDSFDCCIIDYSINEYIFMDNGFPQERVIFNVLSVISMFNKKKCVPCFILLSPQHIPTITNNLYRHIFEHINCPYIDFDRLFHPIKQNIYSSPSHYNAEFQEVIAHKLHNSIINNFFFNKKIDYDFFDTYPICFRTLLKDNIPSNINTLHRANHKSSLLSVNSYLMSFNDILTIESTELYIIAIIYWNSDSQSTVFFKSPNITLKKNFRLKWGGLLTCRSIINSIKGNMSLMMHCNRKEEYINEHTHNSVDTIYPDKSFYLVDILFTDTSPVEYVLYFKNYIRLSKELHFQEQELTINSKKSIFMQKSNSEELIVVFNSHNHKNRYFQLNSLTAEQQTNLLFLADPENKYFLDDDDGLNYSKLLDKYIQRFSESKTTFYGHSMGGFAALYFGIMKNVNILTSMPQVDLIESYKHAWSDLKKTLTHVKSDINLPQYIRNNIKDSVIYLIYGNHDLDKANSDILINTLKLKGRIYLHKSETSQHDFLLHDTKKIYYIHNLLCMMRKIIL